MAIGTLTEMIGDIAMGGDLATTFTSAVLLCHSMTIFHLVEVAITIDNFPTHHRRVRGRTVVDFSIKMWEVKCLLKPELAHKNGEWGMII